MAMVTIDEGVGVERKSFGTRFLEWMERVSQSSPGARAARQYAALDALTDEQLAARGLERADLVEHCFGYHRWG